MADARAKYGKKVLVVGLGALGFEVLKFLCTTPGIDQIVAADISHDNGIRRTNMSYITALQLGYFPKIEYVKMDQFDINGTSETLEKYDPDMVVQLTTLMSWWVAVDLFPKEHRKKLDDAGSGWQQPMQFALAYKMMQAIEQSGISPHVIQGSYSDVNNPILSKLGLIPTCGAGNIMNCIPRLRYAASKKLDVPVRDIDIQAVFHHYIAFSISSSRSSNGAPYYLKVYCRGKDVTEEVDPDQQLKQGWPELPLLTYGKAFNPLVAASVHRTITGILFDTNEIIHTPGPAPGLNGGWPVRVNKSGATVMLPAGISMNEAMKINIEGQKFDGIESIENDGAVIFTEKTAKAMKEVFGLEWKEIKPDRMEDKARELGNIIKKRGKAQGWESVPVWI